MLFIFTNVCFAGYFTGTAFAVSDDGYMVTAAHCVEEADSLGIRIDNKLYKATVIAYDSDKDVALIKINYHFKSHYKIQTEVLLGTEVHILGYPIPEQYGYDLKIVTSIVVNDYMTEFTMTQGMICGGNSGGPVVNSIGEAIGILVSREENGTECSTHSQASKLMTIKLLAIQNGVDLDYSTNTFAVYEINRINGLISKLLCFPESKKESYDAGKERVFFLIGHDNQV